MPSMLLFDDTGTLMLEPRASERDLEVIEDDIAVPSWSGVIDGGFNVGGGVVVGSTVGVVFFRGSAAALATPWLVEASCISGLWSSSQPWLSSLTVLFELLSSTVGSGCLGRAGFVSESMDCIWSSLAFLIGSAFSVEGFLFSFGSWLLSCALEKDDADDEGGRAVDASTLVFVIEGSDGVSLSTSSQRMTSGLRMSFDE